MASQNLKVVVVGDGAVGKSCFLISWTTNSFPGEYVPTVFDNYATDFVVDGKPVQLFLWDTAGQEDYDRLRPLSYPQTDAFILCYSIESSASLANVREKWSPEVKTHCPGTPIVLIGMKTDLRDVSEYTMGTHRSQERDMLTFEDGLQTAREIGAVSFHEVSSLAMHGLNQAMEAVVRAALSHSPTHRQNRRFRLSRLRRHRSKSGAGMPSLESSVPLPPSLPIGEKAPWINIETSSLADDWGKLVNSEQFSDVQFHLENQTFFAHKYVLCSASDLMRRLFGIVTSVKVESIAECPEWTATKLKTVSAENANKGTIKGFVSFREESEASTPNGERVTHITLDHDLISEVPLKRCLQFLYTGYVKVEKDSELLEETVAIARLFNLPELELICSNAKADGEFLNPSIGTWLNDRNGVVAKELFLNKPLMSDVVFVVEGQSIFCHKTVLATRCEVLGAMLTGGFAESSRQQISLPDVSYDNFMAFLEYLYCDHSPIEEGDSVGILVLSDLYVMPRLKSLCELYITKEVDRACSKKIAEADIDVIALLHLAQCHNSRQLSDWCLHFIASNYIAFEVREEFSQLTGDNLHYVQQHRWPPLSYLQAMEKYRQKYGSDQELDSQEGTIGNDSTKKRRRRRRAKCSVM